MRLTRTAAAAFAGVLALTVAAPARAATQVPASFTFVGSGWGHGVGMSQWGAHGMAAEGYTYDQIIGHYFPGTQIAEMSTLADPALETIRVGVMQDGTSITLYGRAVGSSGGGSLDVSVDGGAPIVVFDIPLLFEKGGHAQVDNRGVEAVFVCGGDRGTAIFADDGVVPHALQFDLHHLADGSFVIDEENPQFVQCSR